jgi:hypothetical protein
VQKLKGSLATIVGCVAALCSFESVASGAPRAIATMARPMRPSVARCLIRREPELVQAWLSTLPQTEEEAALVTKAEPRFTACFDPYAHAAGGCAAAYNVGGMRASLVRAMVQHRRGSLPLDIAQPAQAHRWYVTPTGSSRATVDAILAADLGTCLALRRWDDVLSLLSAVDPDVEKLDFVVKRRSEVAQRREAAKVAEVLPRFVPYVGSCVPVGVTLRLDNQRLRAIIEESAFHLTGNATDRALSGTAE